MKPADPSRHDNSGILNILYGSRTGNSKSAAVLAHEYASFLGIKSELINLAEFEPAGILNMKNLLIAVSTHGEGDPPIAAEKMMKYLEDQGTPGMGGAKFSVLALGDSSYRHFCKTGQDFSKHLERLGARSIYGLQQCDIDFEEDAKKWIEGAVNVFRDHLNIKSTPREKKFSFDLVATGSPENGAYRAKVLEKRILNDSNPVKKTMLVKLSLKNSGINYQPGDSIGIYSQNSRRLVDDLIRAQGFDPAFVIRSKESKEMLKQVLISGYELTLLTPLVVKKYAELVADAKLSDLIGDEKKLDRYCRVHDVFDLMDDFPGGITVEQFLSVLRKLPSRLYSIASSPLKDPDLVEILVGLVTYKLNGRHYEGVTSSFLSTRVEEGETVSIYQEENPKFRLPDEKTPVIMIGAGTGLAPFRAFLQHRNASRSPGRNWLFFGERFSATDFFFREELEGYVRNGLLTRLDTAFSRDHGRDKLYVTHKMLENTRELFSWIEEGAVIFLSGNKFKLAPAVRKTLQRIIRQEAGISASEAGRVLEKMKAERRFLEDVY